MRIIFYRIRLSCFSGVAASQTKHQNIRAAVANGMTVQRMGGRLITPHTPKAVKALLTISAASAPILKYSRPIFYSLA